MLDMALVARQQEEARSEIAQITPQHGSPSFPSQSMHPRWRCSLKSAANRTPPTERVSSIRRHGAAGESGERWGDRNAFLLQYQPIATQKLSS